MRGVGDYIALFNAVEPELSALDDLCDTVYENTFIAMADNDGMKRIERIMALYPPTTDTLAKRRATAQTQSVGVNASTKKALEDYVRTVLGDNLVSIEIGTTAHSVTIGMNLAISTQKVALTKQLRMLIPANMTLSVNIAKVNTHEMLSDKQHRELEPYTHEQIASLSEIGA